MARLTTALVVMAPERCRNLIRCVSAVVPRVLTASTCDEAVGFLRTETVGVVLTDLSLPDGSWFDVLNRTSDFQPEAMVVVCARLADERLWTEVLDAGGFDVLAEPYQEPEVQRILNAAAAGRAAKPLAATV